MQASVAGPSSTLELGAIRYPASSRAEGHKGMRTKAKKSVAFRARNFSQIIAASAVTALTLSGCIVLSEPPTGNASVDTSEGGQAAYACDLALAAAEEGDSVEGWTTVLGEEAAPGVRELLSAASLVGGSLGYTLPEHPELSEAGRSIVAGVMRFDSALISDALEEMLLACESVESSGAGDVSAQGQAQYGCALATVLREDYGPVSTWGSLTEEPAWHLAGSVSALFGGLNASPLVGYEEFAEPAGQLYNATATLNLEDFDEALATIAQACGE